MTNDVYPTETLTSGMSQQEIIGLIWQKVIIVSLSAFKKSNCQACKSLQVTVSFMSLGDAPL